MIPANSWNTSSFQCEIMADQETKAEELSCWRKKAAYEKCFDTWYTEVFLQQKSHGKVGCQNEYEAYTRCYMVCPHVLLVFSCHFCTDCRM